LLKLIDNTNLLFSFLFVNRVCLLTYFTEYLRRGWSGCWRQRWCGL